MPRPVIRSRTEIPIPLDMDYKFPHTLFPVYFNSGPPTSKFQHNVGGWGSYGQVFEVNTVRHEEGASLPKVHWKFQSQHQVKGEPWLPLEPVPMPLLKPKRAVTWSSTALPDPLDFSEHMQNFYQYNYKDAFCTMSHVLGENWYFGQGKRKASDQKADHMWQTDNFIESLTSIKCAYNRMGYGVKRYVNLLSDVIHDIPPDLLADLLHEELAHQREQAQFSDNTTGGALEYIPFSTSGALQQGCLVYPGKVGFDNLNFHRVALEFQEGKPCFVLSPTPLSFQLSGPVRQVSIGVRQVHYEVGVRSDYLCGVWRVSEKNKPKILEVVKTKHPATCLSASPHVQGELLVASESGAAHLWTLGRGLQRFRQEDCNLYFNTKSLWRWSDFSGHPRVMVYADRSGVELTDIRVKDRSHTLFRIGQTPDCKSGERVILSKYLSEVHTFHHLITTQYSAYILDERFPCLPVAKQDHMMEQPPMFAQAVAGSPSGGGPTKVLLGSQRSQEVTVLQYSGGREEACVTWGPPRALLSPRDSLGHLSVQLPHRQRLAQDRLAVPAAGLTFIHHSQGKDECICVLQLTEAGDIFYHTLMSQTESDSPATKQNSVGGQDVGFTLPSLSPRTGKQSSRSGDLDEACCSSETSSPDDNRGVEGRSWDIPDSGGLEVVVNDPDYDPDPSFASDVGPSDTQETIGPAPPFTTESVTANAGPVSPRSKVSAEALLAWKKWLLKLFRKRPRRDRCHLPHLTVKTQVLLPRETPQGDPLEKDRLRSLRKDLRETMRRGDVLVHGSTYLKPLALVPIPAPVKTSEWADALSERMTVSWEPGLGGWRSWWLERLGLNREEKVEALRRKRRREKQAKAHRRIDLSGSFTSSISYQSHLDSDAFSGWSSATSQDDRGDSFHYKDWDDLSDPGTPRPTTPNQHMGSGPTTPLGQFSSSWSGTTTPNTEPGSSSHLGSLQKLRKSLHGTTAAPQQSGRSSPPTHPNNESQSPFVPNKQPCRSQAASPHTQPSSTGSLFTPTKNPGNDSLSPWTTVGINLTTSATSRTGVTSQKMPGARDQDYLSVLFGSQEPDLATPGEWFNESSHATPLASSQMSSVSLSQRTPRVGLLSQTSQPKRKKSRMGF
ncbi:TATA box-binding protein-associated factor RNA polymerase I subunit C isoform X1 [Esox lucius]|uniref:Si:ch1073-170h8.3 n=2 Tax=Esox lucius TaxID=8010 RepID=A0A3P9A5Y5_ESOLU|nr:TATA box-binding protein-associated factor RNA polymerase I subunit C isoform X1 [Esox lucius]